MVQGVGSDGKIIGNDKEESFGDEKKINNQFATVNQEFQNPLLFDSTNKDGGGGDDDDADFMGFQGSQAAANNKMIIADYLFQGCQEPCIGLTLRKTPSFLDLLQMKLSQRRENITSPETNGESGDGTGQALKIHDSAEKMKAVNFSASFLKIGPWERTSKYEGDLVAKCYFAKKKLVWEILEGGLKSKMEIPWSEIMAIRANLQEKKPGILDIELNQPPSFYKETEPQPRKHTHWALTSDFTDGQALICRRHHLIFPPGILDKHYEKLLKCDNRLFALSQRPFPSLQSPYFQMRFMGYPEYPFDRNTQAQNIPHGMQYYSSAISPPIVHSQKVRSFEEIMQQTSLGFVESASPMSVMDYSALENQMSFGGNQIEAALTSALPTLVNPHFRNQDNTLFPYEEAIRRPIQNTGVISEIADHLLNDTQVTCFDESLLATVKSMQSLIDAENEANAKQMQFTASGIPVLPTGHLSEAQNRQFFGQPGNWGHPFQVFDENLPMQIPRNNSLYPNEFEAGVVGDFAGTGSLDEIRKQWELISRNQNGGENRG